MLCGLDECSAGWDAQATAAPDAGFRPSLLIRQLRLTGRCACVVECNEHPRDEPQ